MSLLNNLKTKITKGCSAKFHDRTCQVLSLSEEYLSIEYNDYSHEYIPLKDVERLINEGIFTIFPLSETPFPQFKYKDVSILMVYLRDLDNQMYPRSKNTRLAILEKFSSLYGNPFSEGYLYKKYRTWIESGKDPRSISRAGFCHRKSKFSNDVLELVSEVIDQKYLISESHNSIETVYEMYTKKHEATFHAEPMVSRSTFYTIVQSLDAYEVCIARYGREVADAQFRKNSLHYTPNYPLEVAELDAVHLNIGVLDNENNKQVLGTLILYLAIDRYSRAILGYYIGIKKDGAGEDTHHVIKLIQHMMFPKPPLPHCKNPWFAFGKPSIIVLDAGSAFNNQKVIEVVEGFGCTHSVTPTRTPQKKPFIERLMRTVREHFASAIPGYLDKNFKNKYVPANWRELNAFLTISEIAKLFELWVCDHYHIHTHKGLNGSTPKKVWDQYFSQPSAIQPIIPEFNPKSFGKKYTGTIQGGKGIQFGYNFYNSDDLQAYYRTLKTQHNNNPKVTFYIDEDCSPEVIWVDNTHTRKFIMATCYKLRGKQQKCSDSSSLSLASNTELFQLLDDRYSQKQKYNRDNKRKVRKQSAPIAKEITSSDVADLLNRNPPELLNGSNKDNEYLIIDPNDIDPLELY